MQETIDAILERTEFEKKDKLRRVLDNSISISKDTEKSTYAIHDNILFKIEVFFLGLIKLLNSEKRDRRITIGMEIVIIALEELGYDLEKEDVFLFFHLRGLGKFRLKESKLKNELDVLWREREYKEYFLEPGEFSRTLKVLKRANLIEYRRGNLWLKQSTVISYKN